MAAEVKQADVEHAVAAPTGLLDVLHIVAAHNADEGNAAVGICRGAWSDTRIWLAIVNMHHSPKEDNDEVNLRIVGPRLVLASKRGALNVVQRLLDLGADIDSKSAFGNTALLTAIICGHEQVTNLLPVLERNANINVVDHDEYKSALGYACENANIDLVRVLLARGANVDLGDPPILVACTLPGVNNRA